MVQSHHGDGVKASTLLAPNENEPTQQQQQQEMPTKQHDDKILDAINRVAQQLESFNLHYLTKLLYSIVQTVSNLDANVKQLQEKAQVSDIFRHHISSWESHIKSTDQKIDILKKSMDSLPVIENQLQNTDFKVQHIFEKVDVVNEKLHDVTKALLSKANPAKAGKLKDSNSAKGGGKSWSQEDFEQTEILMRLSKLQRILQNTCSSMRLGREMEALKGSSTTSSSTEVDDEASGSEMSLLKALMTKMNANLEKIPIQQIKQSFNLNRKHEKALETISGLVNHIDERTIRIFDTNSYQFKKLMSCCKSTEHEVLTFTNNGNTLLKRVEKAIKSFDEKASTVGERSCQAKSNETTRQFSEVDGNDASGDGDDEVVDERGK